MAKTKLDEKTANVKFRGGKAVHYNNGEGDPLCGMYPRASSVIELTEWGATCEKCKPMQRDINAGFATGGRAKNGVVGLSPNGGLREKLPTNGTEVALAEKAVAEAEEAARQAAATPRVMPHQRTMPPPALVEPDEQADTDQSPAVTTEEPQMTTVPAITAHSADRAAPDSTNPTIVDLGTMELVEQGTKTFRVVVSVKGCPHDLVLTVNAPDRASVPGAVMRRQSLLITEVQESTWMLAAADDE